MPTPKDSTITVRFRASGDRALKRAIEELHLAQVRLEKGTKAYDKAVRQLKLDKERLNNELSYKSFFDFHVINDEIDKAVNEILSIVKNKNKNKGVYNGS